MSARALRLVAPAPLAKAEPCRLSLAEFQAAREQRELPYGADWLLTEVWDRGPRAAYRYQVIGVNLNHAPGGYGYAVSWSVPNLDRRFVMRSELACDPTFDGLHWLVTPLAGAPYAVETIR